MSVIDRDFRQILAELELTSNGTSYKFNGSGGGARESREPVSGDGHPPHEIFRERWEAARGVVEQDRVVQAARQELRHLRGLYDRKVQGETEKDWRARLVREGQGWEIRVVAVRFNTSEKIVRQVRVAAGCFPHDGRVMAGGPVIDREERIREMVAGGATVREITRLLGVRPATVVRVSKAMG